MNSPALCIRNIHQKNNYVFTIEWSDGQINDYRLSSLQTECPCAQCCDEVTGKRLIDKKSIDPQVKAIRLSNVGRYALKIQFTSGCSTGIYSYQMLRSLSKKEGACSV